MEVDTPQPNSAEGAVLTIRRIGLAGDTLRATDFRYDPAPFLDADLDSIAARAARGEPGGFSAYSPNSSPPPDWPVIAARLRAEMDFPPWQLPLEYPWLAQDGSLWLRRSSNRETGTVSWVVLDAADRPRGRLELPEAVQVRWARGDLFWAVVPDELEVPWLVRYRIGGG